CPREKQILAPLQKRPEEPSRSGDLRQAAADAPHELGAPLPPGALPARLCRWRLEFALPQPENRPLSRPSTTPSAPAAPPRRSGSMRSPAAPLSPFAQRAAPISIRPRGAFLRRLE